VSSDVKRKIQSKILSFGDGIWRKRTIRLKELPVLAKRNLWDLVDATSICALRHLKIDTFLLNSNPEEWPTAPEYLSCRKTIESLKVVNDGAERGIALATELNAKPLTRDENQFQKLVQCIEDNRKRFPGVNKSIFVGKK